jgi:2'-5' RNA ligase
MTNLIRSFIALPLAPNIHKNLADFTRTHGLHVRESGLKPVKPENIHLTLKFLAEIDKTQVEKISYLLNQLTTDFSPFTASVQGVGAFPDWNNRPRVVWIGIEPAEQLRKLHKSLDEKLVSLGFPSDRKPFSPHLTLARVSFIKPETGQTFERLKKLSPEPFFGEFMIDRIILFRSVLLPQGPQYSILSSHPFSS